MQPQDRLKPASYLSGQNADYLYRVYRKYLSNPFSVEESWRKVFDDIGDDLESLNEDYSRTVGPISDFGLEDDPGFPSEDASVTMRPGAAGIARSSMDSVRALMLIRAYRIRGHLLAKLDPLGLSTPTYHPDLDPKTFGFEASDYDRPIFLNYVLGMESATLREVMELLRHTYCEHIGVEFMHIDVPERKSWIQERMESSGNESSFTKLGRRTVLERLAEAEMFERFLGRRHIGVKRFGLDGGEVLVPVIEQILKVASKFEIEDVILGMAHRGRINCLANIIHKPYRAIFSEFLGKSPIPSGMSQSGDVKYHLGASADREFDGRRIHVSLAPNPSHLEAVNTVVLGKVRAKQALSGEIGGNGAMGLLIHGDAAMAGQGIVAETFLMSELDGYRTGGTLHLVVNNQIGFTTAPSFSRSSAYCTDIAKVVNAPIFHVNGDRPEACLHAARMAMEYRHRFKTDVVIDVVCYRRHGHNEADEPSFTQPSMYRAIDKHESVFASYRKKLLREGVVTEDEVSEMTGRFNKILEEEIEAAEGYVPNEADWLQDRWAGISSAKIGSCDCKTSVSKGVLVEIANRQAELPEEFTPHPKALKLINRRREAVTKNEVVDWSLAEALAIGTLLIDGVPVRFSGEDSRRGTFSQRHAALVDQRTDRSRVPLNHLARRQAKLEIIDSPLSEFGVLGFEYGFASTDPGTLVVWEAQFGDFANGAQVIVDQFISSGENKWLRMNGLVVLLPHGYEGQGPEHSSARLERYLQLSAEDNWRVCNLSTPANYFHALRHQIICKQRKPLIVMAPKSLLRHKLCVSPLSDLYGDSGFRAVIPDDLHSDPANDDKIRRVVLCSGKVYYDLVERREQLKVKDVYLLRVERLYPYPHEGILRVLSRFGSAEAVWCQEEPYNMGAWGYIDRLLEKTAIAAKLDDPRPIYVGREAAASPAAGRAAIHARQQSALIDEALTKASKSKK